MLKQLFKRYEILPEVLYALKYKLPDKIEVEIKEVDDGYYAKIKNLPGCSTQAKSPQELFEMVNDAVYTYFEIPEIYQPYVQAYIPTEDIRQKFGMKLPAGDYVLSNA